MTQFTPEEAIRARGLRLTWVAEQMGVSVSQLSRLVSGERRWTVDYQRAFTAAVQLAGEAIEFVPEALDSHCTQRGPVVGSPIDTGVSR